MKYILIAVISVLLIGPITAINAGSFDKGRRHISVVLGSGSAFNEQYTVIGAGIDYAVQDGLQIGVDAQAWLGGDPTIYKISPQLSYVFSRDQPLKPYAGVFYRKTFIEDFEDLESAGYRVGAYFNKGAGYQMAVGYVFESYLDCQESIFNDCSDSYPELVLSFAL